MQSQVSLNSISCGEQSEADSARCEQIKQDFVAAGVELSVSREIIRNMWNKSQGRAAAISATPGCSRSAELPYEPSEPGSLGRQRVRFASPLNRAPSGAALRWAPRPRAARPPTAVTFLNGRKSDICIGWTQ